MKGCDNLSNGNLYNYVDVYTKAANASWKRLEIINNNLSNVSTPNFKRQDVEFESYLSQELNRRGTLDEKIKSVNLNNLDYTIYKDRADLSYKTDGNNVDVDTETTYQAEAQIRYNAFIDSITAEFSRIRTVLNK